tara:strand:- start:181 stop:1011 length:831 start_codon:yes stop_codon:yes gene_type:complete
MAKLNTVTSGTRPASPAAGEAYFETDTNKVIIWDGSAWTELASDSVPAFSNAYSVEFDGVDDYFEFGSNTYVDTSSAFSTSAWINLDTAVTGFMRFIILRSNASNAFVSYINSHASYGGLSFGIAGQSTVSTSTDISGSLVNSWNHIAIAYDGNGMTSASSFDVYLNGTSQSLSATGSTSAYGQINSLGKYSSGGGAFIDGKVDELSIFNSVLSSSDVTSIYNSGVPSDVSSLSPVGYWRMGDNDSGTGTTVTDQGSGGNDGTLTNGATFSSDVPS